MSQAVPPMPDSMASGLTSAGSPPLTLLDWLDRLNRWLYSPRSPLIWLTKRRRLDYLHAMEEAQAAAS